MINWVIIVILFIVGFFIFNFIIKIGHTKSKLKFVIIAAIIILLYISATAVLTKNNIKLNSLSGVGQAFSIYFSWLGSAATSLWHAGGQAGSIIGNAIKTNSTST